MSCFSHPDSHPFCNGAVICRQRTLLLHRTTNSPTVGTSTAAWKILPHTCTGIPYSCIIARYYPHNTLSEFLSISLPTDRLWKPSHPKPIDGRELYLFFLFYTDQGGSAESVSSYHEYRVGLELIGLAGFFDRRHCRSPSVARYDATIPYYASVPPIPLFCYMVDRLSFIPHPVQTS